MSTINLATLQSNTALPPTIQNSSAVEIGTFCRAWVNFNGTGTVAIRASFNVSSITDNAVGDYTVNFTTVMSDVNYSTCVSISPSYLVSRTCSVQMASGAGANEVAPTTSGIRFATAQGTTAAGVEYDAKYVYVSVFR